MAANNIQIIGNIINSSTVSRYNSQDTSLISSTTIQGTFDINKDYIEQYVYDAGGNLLNINYNYKNYNLPSTGSFLTSSGSLPIIEIDPVMDIQNLGYSSGEFISQYNFFQNVISDSSAGLFIQEISSDRTEIRAASTTMSDMDLQDQANALINEITGSNYIIDFLLNFGTNQQFVAVNILLEGNEILFKLYQPLPLNIDVKSTFWVVKEKVNPYSFDLNLDKLIIPAPPIQLRGPNFDIEIHQQNNITTPYQNYTELISGLQTINNQSYQQLLSLTTSQSIDINVDYTNYSNFSFFGSAVSRLSNFYYKVQQIEGYNNFITAYSSSVATTASLQTEINQYITNINNIISNFDGYEYYLYFESSSYAWPKTTSTKPYVLASTGSVSNWYNNQLYIAQTYDSENTNSLINFTPVFILEDENNINYLTFLNMIGQYFDNIWVYLKSITDINLSNNNLNEGISKELVYFALQSLGTKLYNTVGNENVDLFYVGANTGSANFDNDFSPTGSFLNNIPKSDLLAELYKRIYHNLPLLLKQKGTHRGLQTFISMFGITGSILNVKEYGGETKAEYLIGYNNDKVRIINNTITGSTLSNILSLQTYTTTSSLFRGTDQHYVDISFSPENQINTYLSASIAVANPTWSIDDFIGDPGYLYSGSYDSLMGQMKQYSSPFTASYLDYAGFIRLIQFFDNSLFKMLKDYVPARTNLSTGITIESPILERNKWSYARPNNTSTIEAMDAVYNGPSASSEYTDLFQGLGGDKKAYYDGNMTGSEYDVYGHWKLLNFNPYDLTPSNCYDCNFSFTASIVTSSISPSTTINGFDPLYTFKHTDFNVLLNNVSESRLSLTRKELELIPYTTHSLLSKAYLQDSYESLRSYQISRYEGSKLTSAQYTFYTPGDTSYGKTAAIDQQTIKFAWVKNIGYNNLNFKDKTQVIIKYLVDPRGSLTELSPHNHNLFEVQNTFKSGTPVIVSVSDPLKPSNQTSLDGNKTIYLGGFSFSPLVFRDFNEPMTFNYLNPTQTTAIAPYINGVSVNDSSVQLDGSKTTDFLTLGSSAGTSNPPSTIRVNNAIVSGEPFSSFSDLSSNWPFSSLINLSTSNVTYNQLNGTSTSIVTTSTASTELYYTLDRFLPNSIEGSTPDMASSIQTISSAGGSYIEFVAPRTSTFNIEINVPVKMSWDAETNSNTQAIKVVGILEKYISGNWTGITNTYWDSFSPYPFTGQGSGTAILPISSSLAAGYLGCDLLLQTYLTWNNKLTLSNYSLTQGDILRFKMYFISCANTWFKSVTKTYFELKDGGYFKVTDSNPNDIYYQPVLSSTIPSIPSFFTIGSNTNTISFSDSGSLLYRSTIFFSEGSVAKANYSPTYLPFIIYPGDLFRFSSYDDPAAKIYTVKQVIPPIISGGVVTSPLQVVFDTTDNLTNTINSAYFAIFRKQPDETSIILNFSKQPGEVSQTSLIPYNIDLGVKENIGNVVSQLNTTIGSNNTIGGGSF